MQHFISSPSSNTVTDVYTNLHGLQGIKNIDNDEALKKVAQQFESLFLNMMMKSMRDANAVFEKDSLFNSSESQFYRDMYDQQLSLTLAHNNGLGIAKMLYQQLGGTGEFSSSPPNMAREVLPQKNPTQLSLKQSLVSDDVNQISKKPATSGYVEIASSPTAFIKKLLPIAKSVAKKIGVTPQLLVAQAALETGWGKFVIANKEGLSSNNLFNIKAGSGWKGSEVTKDTLEFIGGTFIKESAQFRRYDSLEKSFEDYANLIINQDRYSDALKNANNDVEYIKALQKAGYATDPKYAEKVSSIHARLTEYFEDN